MRLPFGGANLLFPSSHLSLLARFGGDALHCVLSGTHPLHKLTRGTRSHTRRPTRAGSVQGSEPSLAGRTAATVRTTPGSFSGTRFTLARSSESVRLTIRLWVRRIDEGTRLPSALRSKAYEAVDSSRDADTPPRRGAPTLSVCLCVLETAGASAA